jgi:glucose-6-phosphate dehydrogenase assembly protein OpcA
MNAEPTRQDMLAVEIQSIKEEWMRLWKESVAAIPTNDGHPATRNSVLNLIVFTRRAKTAAAVEGALGNLCRHHPARVLLLIAEPEIEPPSMRAWVNQSCYQDRQRWGYNTSEQVTIEANGTAVHFLPGVVLSLLAANLPVFMWWADALPLDHALFERLVGVSDRMVVDSAEFEHLEGNLSALARITRSRHYRCAASDLNWQRLAPWRELTAQFFDLDALQPYLRGISHLLIEYAGHEANGQTVGVSNPAQALLLVGWMASVLGWSLVPGQQKKNGGTFHLELRTEGQKSVLVEIRPRSAKPHKKPLMIQTGEHLREQQPPPNPTWMVSQAVAGALSTLIITSSLKGHTASFEIRRSPDHEHATTSCTIDGAAWGQQRTVHLDSIGRSELLSAELEVFSHDEGFEDALSVAGALAE